MPGGGIRTVGRGYVGPSTPGPAFEQTSERRAATPPGNRGASKTSGNALPWRHSERQSPARELLCASGALPQHVMIEDTRSWTTHSEHSEEPVEAREFPQLAAAPPLVAWQDPCSLVMANETPALLLPSESWLIHHPGSRSREAPYNDESPPTCPCPRGRLAPAVISGQHRSSSL